MGAQCTAQNPDEIEASQNLDDHIGEGTSLALKRLAIVVKETNASVYKAPLDHPALLDLGLIMKQCYEEERYKKPLPPGKSFGEIPVFMRATRYAKYAKAAYENGEEEILKSIQGDAEDFGGNVEILHIYRSAGGPKDTCPSFFAAADKGTGEIVVSICGVATMPEAITEAVGETTPFLNGAANEALLAKSSQLLQQAQEPLQKALEGNAKGAVSFVGHGIGGGIAALATVQAFGEGSFLQKFATAGRVKCYAFGPPPTFEPANKVPPKCAAAIYTFVNNMDCIPRASLGSIGKLLQAVRKVDALQYETGDRVQLLKADSETTQEELPDFEELPDELKPELTSLYGLGTVLVLYKNGDGKRICEKVSADTMDRILMHPGMIDDHLMIGYEEAISETFLQLNSNKGCC